MADVARRVGVSRQLVGLVFRDEAGVGPDTKERILAAARELGYSPNIAAQSLRRVSTKYIGVQFDPSHQTASEIIEELYLAAAPLGYKLVLSATDPGRDEKETVEELIGYRVETLILIAPRLDAAELRAVNERVPTVVIAHRVTGSGCDIVTSSGDLGIERIVGHLVGLGHTRIAFVDGASMMDADVRLGGYERGMAAAGLTARIERIEGPYTEESGAAGALRFLNAAAAASAEAGTGELLPTAIVCNNDQAAVGLIFRLLKAGIRVPEDVSVTGYDDSPMARLSYISLTTVRQDAAEVAGAAIDAAIARATGERLEAIEVRTSSEVVVRKTTAPPRK